LQPSNDFVDRFRAFDPDPGFFRGQRFHTLQLLVVDKAWTHYNDLMTDQPTQLYFNGYLDAARRNQVATVDSFLV
jgi:hypothetical protein